MCHNAVSARSNKEQRDHERDDKPDRHADARVRSHSRPASASSVAAEIGKPRHAGGEKRRRRQRMATRRVSMRGIPVPARAVPGGVVQQRGRARAPACVAGAPQARARRAHSCCATARSSATRARASRSQAASSHGSRAGAPRRLRPTARGEIVRVHVRLCAGEPRVDVGALDVADAAHADQALDVGPQPGEEIGDAVRCATSSAPRAASGKRARNCASRRHAGRGHRA